MSLQNEQLLDDIIAKYPSFHLQPNGSPWFLGISGDNFKYMFSLLQPGMRTIETGAGFSTLAFICAGCSHTAICPAANHENVELEARIRSYCSEHNLDASKFTFLDAKSQDIAYTFTEKFDFVFIDGEHGFPIPIIDFYYLARSLKVGGVLAIDDTHIWTGEILEKYLMLDADWRFLSKQDGKTAYFRREREFRDKTFSEQTYVLVNSHSLSSEFLASLRR